MNCDLTKNRLTDEDFVFIIFNLLRQTSPQSEAVFEFKSLCKADYKNIHRLKNKEIFCTISKIKNDYGIEIKDLNFNFGEFCLSANACNKELIDFAIEGGHTEEDYVIEEKIANNNFDFADLEKLEKLLIEEKFEFNDILGGINFTGTIPRKNKSKLKQHLDQYISSFVNEDLLPDKKVYDSYLEHKRYTLPRLYEIAKTKGKNTAVGTSHKDSSSRFIEPLIKLEMEGYVKIYELKTFRDSLGFVQYRADIKIEEKLTKQSKYAKSEKPHVGLIDLPKGTGWDKIHLILCENYDIKVKFDDETFIFDCEKFSFIDRRKKGMTTVKESWDFLLFLAINKGTFFIKNISVLNNFIAESKETTKKILTKEDCQKRKSELTKILKDAFPQIKGEPFEKWDKNKEEYKINIKLTPTEPFRFDYRDKNIKDEAEKSNPYADLKDSYENETPEI